LTNLTLEFEIIAYALKEGMLPDGIKPINFFGEKSRWIASKIEKFGTAITVPIFLMELETEGRDESARIEYQSLLERLYQKPVSEKSVRIAVDKVRELHLGRELAALLSDPNGIAEMLKGQKIREAVTTLEQFLYSKAAPEGVISQGDLISSSNDVMAEIIRSQKGFCGVPTWIPPIDDAIGGLIPQEIGAFVGGTGEGKSLALLDIGMRTWLHDKNVCAFSLEMRRMQQHLRQVAWLKNIEFTRFRGGQNVLPVTDAEVEEIRNVLNGQKERKNIFHWVDIPKNINAAEVERLLIKAERERKCQFDLLLVDYLGVMSPIGRFDQRTGWDAQGEIAWNMHNLARKINKPIWTAIQKKENISQKQKDKAGLGVIGLSYLIAQALDIVIVLKEKTLEGTVEAVIAKGRDVAKKTVILKPELRFARIHRMEEGNA
jgi:replicative DNA helicase